MPLYNSNGKKIQFGSKMQAVEIFKNTRLVYVNSYYRAGDIGSSASEGICQKIEICLLENRQCTYYQNWQDKPDEKPTESNPNEQTAGNGIWSVQYLPEREFALIINLSSGLTRNFKIHINNHGNIFLNGKRFQVYKIKK